MVQLTASKALKGSSHMKKRIILAILFPIVVFLWLLGWTLFWTDPQRMKNKSDKNQTAVKEAVIEIADPFGNEVTNYS
jgi:flagellar basal body-associated protein FliL